MANWLITGCSTGLGRALARAVLAAGHNVVVTARKLDTIADILADYPDSAVAAVLDVSRSDQIAAAVKLAEDRFGGIDVLVNNAGYGYRAAVEEAEQKQVAELFQTNFFGTVAMIQAVLPDMRARRSGTIVNLSSIAGRFAAPGSAFYAASKFAVEGLSDALRKEVEPLGIHVLVIEPGAFRTDFAGRSLHGSQTAIADYAATAGPRRKENDHTHGTQNGDPERAAKVILETAMAADPPFRLLLGSDAVAAVRAELEAQCAELEAWKAISLTTDYPAEP
jgi:NAD(P)-dependent dehydrogenase (short-subunit alcohol dehydrogenase family)